MSSRWGAVCAVAVLWGCGSSRPVSLDGRPGDPPAGDTYLADLLAPDLRPFVDRAICAPPETTLCGTICVDTQTDDHNCGACGIQCNPFEPCQGGKCYPPGCHPDFLRCNGFCVDPKSDPNNCGACGIVCDTAVGLICSVGTCKCAMPGLTDCFNQCTNLMTDPNNCGACGNACNPGQTCAAGSCGLPCPGIVCNGTCVDPNLDNNNCGMCGNACVSGQTCAAGICADPPFVAVMVTCPSLTLAVGLSMQCIATGVMQNGATANVTAQVSWSAANSGPCAGAAGAISSGGTFTAQVAGCKSDISATWPGSPSTSNTVTVTIVN